MIFIKTRYTWAITENIYAKTLPVCSHVGYAGLCAAGPKQSDQLWDA